MKLEDYFGKDYLSKNLVNHCRVMGRSMHPTHANDPFAEYTLDSFCVYKHVPLRNEINGGVSPEVLKECYMLVTPLAKILYYD